eukprot:1147345-Pelagomonas_calceolata.AAC.1
MLYAHTVDMSTNCCNTKQGSPGCQVPGGCQKIGQALQASKAAERPVNKGSKGQGWPPRLFQAVQSGNMESATKEPCSAATTAWNKGIVIKSVYEKRMQAWLLTTLFGETIASLSG